MDKRGDQTSALQHVRLSRASTTESYAEHNSRWKEQPFSLIRQTEQFWTGSASMSCQTSGVVLSKCSVRLPSPYLRDALII